MTDITELAQRMKAAAVRAKAATEDYVAHRMSITVCLEECKEFNDLSDGPDNILALVEALEHYKSREERVTKLVLDNSASWDELYQKLESEKKRNADLVEALEKAQAINAAAEKLVRCKGRYHSELNYRALAALFGVTTPDLPPLDGESRIVKLPAACADDEYFIDGVFQPLRYERDVERALRAAGIKWEAE